MRRSISYTEPKVALAGETKTWKFIYTPANDLPKGARLKFDLGSKGRSFDWELPQTNLKSRKNLIWLETPSKKGIGATEVSTPDTNLPQYEFTLPGDVKAGEEMAIYLGTPDKAGTEKEGSRAQSHTFRRRPFGLYIDAKGKGEYKESETFHIDVKGNELHSIRIIVPSIVNKNQRFDVIVRFEDQFGNLTGNAPEGTLVEFSYERLRENINWKLFVPETGFINLPNLYFNEPGIYKIQLKTLTTNETFSSSPIKCFSDTDRQLYWGNFHGESILYDAGQNIESCLRYIRDEEALQFFSTSSFESERETPADIWKGIGSHVAEFNEDDRFTTFLGMQWAGTPGTEGLRQIIYTKDSRPILRKKESKANHIKKIYNSHIPKDFVSIPTFTMGSETFYDFENFTPEYEKVVEIYNAWGSSECTKAEGNLRPISSKSKKGMKEKAEGSIRKALNKNLRFGFVAGGLDDRGVFQDLFDTDQVQYSPGLTAILAANHSRDGLIQSLNKKSCYATTGPRIIAGIEIAGAPMGSELNTKAKPGLAYNRHLTGYAVGTAPIKEILIIRNGKPFHTFNPKDDTFEFAHDDDQLLEKIALKPKGDNPPFVYYYMRVEQGDGHIAWTSPVWVDLVASATPDKKKK
ncbi:MAG: DUF3604 domain-containing protein [Candidatus Neptunochlamydia sp.]|nr:DUF3604 domain-containing protein [Candidatus Neptunochlamydia sp.]